MIMTYIKSKKIKIAIIGGGISGLSAAYLLSKNYNIALYESKSYLGGHALTLKKTLLDKNNKPKTFYFDIGFLVYNEKNYPNFKKLLEKIKVKNVKSNMSFSVSDKEINYEYGSTGLLSITNNFKNLFYRKFWIMLSDIFRFYILSKKFLKNSRTRDFNLNKFLKQNKFSDIFIRNHLIPMWDYWSTSTISIKDTCKYILKF